MSSVNFLIWNHVSVTLDISLIAFQKFISNFVIQIPRFTKSNVKVDVNSKNHQTNLIVIAFTGQPRTVIAAVGNSLFNVTTHKIALWRNDPPVQEQYNGCKSDLKGSKKLPKIVFFLWTCSFGKALKVSCLESESNDI